MARRRVMSVLGFGGELDPPVQAAAHELGRRAIDAGFRIATGGLGGVMAAVCKGAHSSARRREGDVLGFLPSYEAASANEHVDVAVPTGLGLGRNIVLVASADVVVAVGGGAGTLGELAMAWQLGRPVIALDVGGWSSRLAGEPIDERRADRIHRARDPAHAVEIACSLLDGSQ